MGSESFSSEYYNWDSSAQRIALLRYPAFYLNSKLEIVDVNETALSWVPQLCVPGELATRIRADNIIYDNLLHHRAVNIILYDLPLSYQCLNILPLRHRYFASLSAPPRFSRHPINLAEQFRNPLSEIFATLPILSQHLVTTDDSAHLRHINSSCYRILREVETLSYITRISQGDLGDETPDLAELTRNLCRAYSDVALPGLPAVTCHVPNHPLVVHADVKLLDSLLENLLSNALRFTRDGNKITVSLRELGNRCLLSVRDRGAGIRPEVLPHVFDTYYSAPIWPDEPSPGLGLGLSYVHSLVSLMGGSVTLESVWGEGSSVTVALPLLDSEPCGACRTPAEYLTERYSSLFVNLCDFCRLPEV